MNQSQVNRKIMNFLRDLADEGTFRMRKKTGHPVYVASYGGVERSFTLSTSPENDCLEGIAMAVSGCDASIEVDDDEIENPFRDYEKYEVPELEVLIPEIINSKFCCLKVWENSGEWTCEGEGDFDLSKLSWEKGRFTYDGEEFDSLGGEGSSSYTHFYKDGEEIC